MADQPQGTNPLAPGFDWRLRESERDAAREAQEQANREDPAYVEFFERYAGTAGKRAAGVLYEVAKELRKRPYLKETLSAVASELDTLFAIVPEWPDVKRRMAEGSSSETEIRRLLGDMFPEARRERAAAVIAEIVYERERLDRLWERVDAADAEGKETAPLLTAFLDATLRVQESVLSAIVDGEVDGVEAARALKARKVIKVNPTEHPELTPPVESLSDSDEDLKVLAEIAIDIKTQIEHLSDGSRWRVPLNHIADRLMAPRGSHEGAVA